MADRKAYQDKMRAQLNEWSAKIDELSAKAEKASADLKMRYQNQVKELRTKQGTVKEKLQEMMRSSDDAWEKAKQGFEKSWSELKTGMENAISKIK